MKKIGKYLLLMVICLLPLGVLAKEKYEFDWNIDNRAFLFEENDIYYFTDYDTIHSGKGKFYSYDVDGNLLKEEIFFDEAKISYLELKKTRRYIELIPYFEYYSSYSDYFYSEGLDKFIEVFYDDEFFSYYDDEKEENYTFDFSKDVNFTKQALGKKYDVFIELKKLNLNVEVYKIDIFDNIYVAYYEDENMYINTYMFGSNYNLIMEYKSEAYVANVYEKDGIVYIIDGNKNLVTYRLDGTVIDNFALKYEWFDEEYLGSCNDVTFNKAYISNNKLFLTFRFFSTCDERLDWKDATEVVTDVLEIPKVFTIVYNLNYKVETVESSNGEFTYDTKVDGDGKSYVELKITPKDGYSVKEIIVTDVNGNRIEVINNKFYKPMNDVKIEVKYAYGEYLPIPDTFLGKSFTLIFIGIILVGLGFYTISYVKGEQKVDL